MIRNTLAAAGLSAILATSNIAYLQETLETLPEVRKGACATYITSAAKGEMQLHQLAQESDVEDAWLRINDYWIDIGFNEMPCKVTIKIASLDRWARALIRYPEKTEAVFYHIHPLDHEEPQVSPPNWQDIHTHAQFKKYFRNELKTSLISKVFDGFGVWSYDVTAGIEARLTGINVLTREGKRTIARLDARDDDNVRKYLFNESISFEDRISRYIRATQKKGVILRFTPMD